MDKGVTEADGIFFPDLVLLSYWLLRLQREIGLER